MADEQVPLVGLLQALQGKQQPPLTSLPDVGAPLIGPGPQVSPGLPWANRAADIGSRYVGDQVSGLAKLLATPGAATKPNPYPAGSEESAWYDQNRQDAVNQWAPGMALGMIGSGTPFAEAGALGATGGRRLTNFSDIVAGKAKAEFDPAEMANWIWQTSKGKQKAALDLMEQQKQRQFMRWTPEEIAQGLHGGQTPEQWGQIENSLRSNFDKPFVSDAQLDRVAEFAHDLRDDGKPVTLDILKKKFPKIEDEILTKAGQI